MTKDGAGTEDAKALRRQVEALRDRISKLSGALLQISASLDPDTVVRELVDSARALTGARYGVIAIGGEAGRPMRFVSSGLTPDEHRQLAEWSEAPRLFEHIRDLPDPFRVRDAPGYLRSLGLTSPPVLPRGTLQGMPVRLRGEHVGALLLAEKEGGREFTDEDEEALALFVSQAATAVANARAYRDERRARANLEALVDTSPVGVVVFDAETGDPLLSNREVMRIVGGLVIPGHSPEHLLEVMTVRRADGRETELSDFPMAQQLSNAKTVRNEEMVLSVPDGRSLRALVSVTPIRAPDGGIESVVATIQDLEPFEELERMRTEFLAIVSHELRAPLTSIKGSAATVLASSPGLASAEMLQFFRIIDAQADQMSGLIGDLLDAGRIATGTLSVSQEVSEVGALVDRARNTFASGGRHTILVDLPRDLPRVMVDRQRVVQVLNNLLSNAARNAPESSPIRVAARRDGAHVAISVSDRGRGIRPDRLPHLFRKHTGAGGAEGGLGRGLGLAICKGLVEAHGGRIRAASGGEGKGARFTFTVPAAEEAPRDPAAAGFAEGSARARPQGGSPVRVLVVDDDPQMLLYVRDALTAAGYAAVATGEPRDLSRVIREEKPHLVLLDLMFSGTDGIRLMEEVPELAGLPVIFVSAYGRDETIARALGAGAADYIVKPFSPAELVARVRAALRMHAGPEPFSLGELAIDYERRRVTLAGRPVELTTTEYEVLRVLSANAGRVLTYGALLRQAWGRHPGHAAPKRVHAVVKRLRRKLGEDAARAAYVLTERGVGYRMPAPGEIPS